MYLALNQNYYSEHACAPWTCREKGESDSFVWWSHSSSVECIKNLSRLKTDPRRIISVNSTPRRSLWNNYSLFEQYATEGCIKQPRFQKIFFSGCCDFITKQRLLVFSLSLSFLYWLFSFPIGAISSQDAGWNREKRRFELVTPVFLVWTGWMFSTGSKCRRLDEKGGVFTRNNQHGGHK